MIVNDGMDDGMDDDDDDTHYDLDAAAMVNLSRLLSPAEVEVICLALDESLDIGLNVVDGPLVGNAIRSDVRAWFEDDGPYVARRGVVDGPVLLDKLDRLGDPLMVALVHAVEHFLVVGLRHVNLGDDECVLATGLVRCRNGHSLVPPRISDCSECVLIVMGGAP